VTGEAIEVAFAVPVESLASQIETHDVITLESLDAEDLARHFHLLASLSKFFNCSILIERPSLDNVISGASKELIIVGPAKIVSAHLVASLKVFDKSPDSVLKTAMLLSAEQVANLEPSGDGFI